MYSESKHSEQVLRPRRRRRWWIAALLVLLIVVVTGLVAASFVEPWLQRQAVVLVRDKAGSDLAIADLDISWWPLGLTAADVALTLDGEREPWVAVEGVSAEVDVRELLRGRVKVGRLKADRPVLSLRVRGDGSLALPDFAGDGGGDRFELESLQLADGEIRWQDARLPMQATLSGLSGESSAAAGGGSAVNFRADRLDLDAAGGEVDFTVDGQIAWQGAQFELVRLHGASDRLTFDVNGSLAGGNGAFKATAEGALAVLEPWLGDQAGLSGNAFVSADISNTDRRDEDGWVVAGDGRVEDLRYADVHLGLVPLRFTVIDGALRAESEGLRAWDGTWQSSFNLDGGRARIELSGGGASLDRLATDLGWPSLASDGAVSGHLDYRFELAQWRQGRGAAEVEITPAGDWTLGGTAPIEIRPGLQLALSGSLASPAAQVELQGQVDAAAVSGAIEFQVETADLASLQQQLGLTGDFLPTRGSGNLDGRLTLDDATKGPSISLRGDLRDLAIASLVADTATAVLQIDDNGLTLERAELTRAVAAGEPAGTALARLTGSGSFPADGSHIGLDATATAWPVEQLLPLAGLELPLTGLASGSVELLAGASQHAATSVDGNIDLTLTQPAWDGIEIGGTVHAPITIDGNAISLVDGVWEGPGGELQFAFRTDPSGSWRAQVDGRDLLVARWLSELEVLGEGYRASIDLTAHGAEELESADLELVTERPGDREPARLSGRVEDGQLQASGDLAGVVREAEIAGVLSEAGPDITATGLVQLTDWVEQPEFELDGSLRVDLKAEGSWQQPVVVAEASALQVTALGQTLQELEPIRAVLRPGQLELESAYVENPRTGGELFVAGIVDLETQTLDGVLQADLDAVWMHGLVPDLTTTGGLSFLGSIVGTVEDPILDGQGEWSDGTARYEGFPHTLNDISLRFLTGSGGIVIDRAVADLGGGSLTASGTLDLDPDRGLSYSARLAAREVNANVPEDWWIGGDATVRIEGDAESRLISGDVSLERAVLLESVDLSVEQLLRAAFERQREWVASTDELLRSTRLQLQVSGDDALQVSGEGLNLSGDIDLSIGGDLASPLILGQVDLTAGSQIVFRSNSFQVERGLLVFSNPHVIDPEIELVAVSQVRSYDVRLHLRGTLESMDIEFTSDPALPSLEVVSLLTTGQVGRQPLLLEPVTATESTAAEGLIAGQAAEALGSRVGRLFGLDRVQVDPLTGSSGSLSSARITVGKRLSDDVVATYSYDPTDSEEQVVQLDWQLTPAVAMVLTQNGDGSYAVDFKLQQSF